MSDYDDGLCEGCGSHVHWRDGWKEGLRCDGCEKETLQARCAELEKALQLVVDHDYGRADVFDTMKNTIDYVLACSSPKQEGEGV